MLRKFLLTVFVVLFDSSGAFNVTVGGHAAAAAEIAALRDEWRSDTLVNQFAILVSAFAHVLHGVYKPFPDRSTYLLQHLSLTTTTLTFTMGLLVKVDQVDNSSPFFSLLTAVTVMLPLVFIVASTALVVRHLGRVAHAKLVSRELHMLRTGVRGRVDSGSSGRAGQNGVELPALGGSIGSATLQENPMHSRHIGAGAASPTARHQAPPGLPDTRFVVANPLRTGKASSTNGL